MTEPLRHRKPLSETVAAVASPAETMFYIKDLLGSLLDMAECRQQIRLAELLEMARKEAEDVSRRLARV